MDDQHPHDHAHGGHAHDEHEGQHHDDQAHDHPHDHAHPADSLSRRDLLKVSAGVTAALPFLSLDAASALEQMRQGGTAAASKLVFFTRAQLATVDALSERIIPADSNSPGAHAARVADFIDLLLSEQAADLKAQWTDGIAALDKASADQFKVPFVKASAEQQIALLTEMSKNELTPKTPLELFFVEAKGRTIQGYYTSKIGIHDELKYKGNQFLPEFVGYSEQA
jgi:hypothetical protein